MMDGGSAMEMGMSPEIVEISEEERESRSIEVRDVYVAVGKDDTDVVRWALNNAATTPGSRISLIHVSRPTNSIPTPVGRLSKSQVSREQFQAYLKQKSLRRQNLLQKYIRLCADSEVAVDTVLIDSNFKAKAIADLIPILNITRLIMGSKHPSSRRLRRRMGKGEYVCKHAPDDCNVTIICDGKSTTENQQVSGIKLMSPLFPSSRRREDGIKMQSTLAGRRTERKSFECTCFSIRFT